MIYPPLYYGGRAGTLTHYKNTWFRSNLESRWAEYLDACDIPWRYEKHTFRLNGAVYTPDFYLPAEDMFLEVKPGLEALIREGLPKMNALCTATKRRVIAGVGFPGQFDGFLYMDPALPAGKRLSRATSISFGDGFAYESETCPRVLETTPTSFFLEDHLHEPSLT